MKCKIYFYNSLLFDRMDDDIWDICDDVEYDKIMSERDFSRLNEINQNVRIYIIKIIIIYFYNFINY